MYAVFDLKAPRAEVDRILQDRANDLVSRQSITIREGKVLGFPDHGILVLIEGSEAGIALAAQAFAPVGKRLDSAPAEAVRRAIEAQEDDAVSGMGFIFG